jgi:hypothetical protein
MMKLNQAFEKIKTLCTFQALPVDPPSVDNLLVEIVEERTLQESLYRLELGRPLAEALDWMNTVRETARKLDLAFYFELIKIAKTRFLVEHFLLHSNPTLYFQYKDLECGAELSWNGADWQCSSDCLPTEIYCAIAVDNSFLVFVIDDKNQKHDLVKGFALFHAEMIEYPVINSIAIKQDLDLNDFLQSHHHLIAPADQYIIFSFSYKLFYAILERCMEVLHTTHHLTLDGANFYFLKFRSCFLRLQDILISTDSTNSSANLKSEVVISPVYIMNDVQQCDLRIVIADSVLFYCEGITVLQESVVGNTTPKAIDNSDNSKLYYVFIFVYKTNIYRLL